MPWKWLQHFGEGETSTPSLQVTRVTVRRLVCVQWSCIEASGGPEAAQAGCTRACRLRARMHAAHQAVHNTWHASLDVDKLHHTTPPPKQGTSTRTVVRPRSYNKKRGGQLGYKAGSTSRAARVKAACMLRQAVHTRGMHRWLAQLDNTTPHPHILIIIGGLETVVARCRVYR